MHDAQHRQERALLLLIERFYPALAAMVEASYQRHELRRVLLAEETGKRAVVLARLERLCATSDRTSAYHVRNIGRREL